MGYTASGLYFLFFLWLPQQPVGQPASANDVYRYTLPNAEVVINADTGSIFPAMIKGFNELGQQSFVKQRSRGESVLSGYEQAKRNMNNTLNMIKMMGNIDPTKDIRWVTFSLRLKDINRGKIDMLAAFGGKFPAQMPAKIERATTKKIMRNGTIWLSEGKERPSIALTNQGILLFGKKNILLPMMKRAPRHAKLAKVAMTQHTKDAFISGAINIQHSKLKQKAIKEMIPPFRPLVNFAGSLAFSLRYDGLTIGVTSKNGRMLRRYKTLLDGAGDSLLAMEIFMRGAFKTLDGLIDPKDAKLYDSNLGNLVKDKRSLMKYIRSYKPFTQNPSYKVSIDGRQRMALLHYKGSRYVGLFLPLVSIIADGGPRMFRQMGFR